MSVHKRRGLISGRWNRASSRQERRMFKHRAVGLAIAVAVFSVPATWSQDAAKPQETTPSVAPAVVEITPKTLDVHVGQKVKFSAAAKDAAGNPIDAKPSVWFAAPFDLAGADESGEVTFHAPGIVTVGAVIAGKTGYATVNVANSRIATLELEALPHSLVAGSAEKLNLTARTSNGNPRMDAPIQWTSDKPSIASVDAAGLVTGVAAGSATIKAIADGASAEVKV